MKALAIGKPAVGTRYIAEREANQEREGTNRRPLFSDARADLTPAQANQHLSDGNGKPAKSDLRHVVISPESARAFESLGDTHEERREQFIECTRATIARFAKELGVTGLRWVAGVHLNTNHPHVHILLSKDAYDAETGRPKRINHIPREWLIHTEQEQEEPEAGREKATDATAAGASAQGATEGAQGAQQETEAPAAQAPSVFVAYRPERDGGQHLQLYKGTQVLLDRSRVRAESESERRVEVALDPREIFDPKGVIEGTDRVRSEADEQRMYARLEGVQLAEYSAAQTGILTEFGYKAAAEWEGGERDEKNPRREVIVFDPAGVRDVEEGASQAQAAPGGASRGDDDRGARTNYGRLGEVFAEEVEARAFPVRQIAFHIDHGEDFTRRGLLDSRQRKPTETERQIGRWVMLEANLNGHETKGSRILRLRLREEVQRLDAAAVERGQPRPLAYIPTKNLEDSIARNTVSVLRDDGTLAPRYHTPTKSRADEARERIFDLQPSHGGEIYGLVTGDSNRFVVREFVTVGPNLREPAPEPEPVQQAHDADDAAAVEQARATPPERPAEPSAAAGAPPSPEPTRARAVESDQAEPSHATRQPALGSRESEVTGAERGAGTGWRLSVTVAEEHRAEFAARLSELREANGVQFNYMLWLDREQGHGITSSVSDARGREDFQMHSVLPPQGMVIEEVVTIDAGSRATAERVTELIDTHLRDLTSEPRRGPIPGEVIEHAFSNRVVGEFNIERVDPDFSNVTRWGVPLLREDSERLAAPNRLRGDLASRLGGEQSDDARREALEQAAARADGVLKERYGAFYAGASYVGPEREEPRQEAARPQEERREQPQPEAVQEAAQSYEPKALKPGKGDWIHVTPDSRCPVCKKPDNCAVSVDGKKAYCRRVESPKQGRDGGYVHDLTKLDGYQVQEQRPTGPAVVQYERRPVEDRDRVYRKVFESLRLEERDREALRGRGLSDEAIERGGYVSAPRRAQANEIAERLAAEGEDLRGVPGFWRADPEEGQAEGEWQLNLNYWYRGTLVPVHDQHGRVEGIQVRRAEVKEHEPRYVWLSSKSGADSPKPEGTPSGAPVHFTNVEDIKARGEAILTEGSLKANVISEYTDRGTIAIAGVSVFQDDFGERLKKDVPELRRVWIAYDADAADKKEVRQAQARLTRVLEKAGLEVGSFAWNGDQGKGLDDYCKTRLGEDFNHEQRDDRAEAQARVLHEVGWRPEGVGQEQNQERAQTPPPPLRPGMVDEQSGHEIREEELTVARWLKYETADAEEGRTSPTLRSLRGRVSEIDEAARAEGQPETAAVVRVEELERARGAGLLLTRDEILERQHMADSVARGKELEARLELVHAGEQFERACGQAATRRYETVDATSGHRREMSERDVEQRAHTRGRRATAERAEEIEQAEPVERRARRVEIRDETTARDVDEHGETLRGIQQKHADQLRALDRNLVKAQRAHDAVAPDAHAVERAYRARGEEPPSPFIGEEKLDRLHDQAIQRKDVETVKRLDSIREEIAREHGVPARDDERTGRLAAQRNVAESDLKVSQHRAGEFERQKHNRKFEVEGETKKWSLSEVDREQRRSEKELEYLSTTARFWGTRGLAAQLFKQQVLQRVNPLNSLRLSTLNPLYPIKHHPVVKGIRIAKQVYDWHQRARLTRELAEQATARLSQLGEIRPKLEERIAERQAQLESEVTKNADLSNALNDMHARTAEGRATPAEPTYSKYELRRLESNAQELRSPEMLRDFERAARSQVEQEVARVAEQLASGKTAEEVARELAEERIKEAMRGLEPTEAQAYTLRKLGQDVPTNRMEASQQIEELTGEESVWKKAGREAAEAACQKPMTPEEILKDFRETFGSRAAAREITSEARAQEAARSLEQFKELREVTQVRYLDAEGQAQTGSLKETEPKNWMDSLKRLLAEPEETIAKRASIEESLEAEEARLSSEYDEARSFADAAKEIADGYRAELEAGEVLRPYFTPGEAADLERIGGGLKPAELQQLEAQAAELTAEQAQQVEYSRIVQDALAEGRVGTDPAARSAEAAREADPIEHEARELAESAELEVGEGAGVEGAEVAATTEAEASLEEGLTLLL